MIQEFKDGTSVREESNARLVLLPIFLDDAVAEIQTEMPTINKNLAPHSKTFTTIHYL